MPTIRLRSKGRRCPLCRVAFLPGDIQEYRCPACDVLYHQDCAEEMGGCATLGCERLGVAPGDPTPTDQRRRARLRRHLAAARERRQDRPRMREEHRERLATADAEERAQQSGRSGWADVAEAVIAGIDCISLLGCLFALGSLLISAALLTAYAA